MMSSVLSPEVRVNQLFQSIAALPNSNPKRVFSFH